MWGKTLVASGFISLLNTFKVFPAKGIPNYLLEQVKPVNRGI